MRGPNTKLQLLIFLVINLCLHCGSVRAQYYELAWPDISTSGREFCKQVGFVKPHTYMKGDSVARWMAIIRDYGKPSRERIRALQRLYDYPQRRVERAIVNRLGDHNMEVRRAAAIGLGKLGYLSSVRVLIDALRYCKGRCRQAVRASLLSLTKQDLGNDRGTWRRWYSEHRRDYR